MNTKYLYENWSSDLQDHNRKRIHDLLRMWIFCCDKGCPCKHTMSASFNTCLVIPRSHTDSVAIWKIQFAHSRLCLLALQKATLFIMLLLYYKKILTRTVATEPHFLFTSLLHGHGITGKKVMFSCEAPSFPVIMLLSASSLVMF